MPAAVPHRVSAAGLTAAVIHGDVAAVADLLAQGADPNATNADGWTPLMFAALNPEVAMVDLLVGAGADVNRTAVDGTTPLMKAALWRNTPIAIALLEHGADPAVQDKGGWTAASIAAAQGDTELVKRLTAARE